MWCYQSFGPSWLRSCFPPRSRFWTINSTRFCVERKVLIRTLCDLSVIIWAQLLQQKVMCLLIWTQTHLSLVCVYQSIAQPLATRDEDHAVCSSPMHFHYSATCGKSARMVAFMCRTSLCILVEYNSIYLNSAWTFVWFSYLWNSSTFL